LGSAFRFVELLVDVGAALDLQYLAKQQSRFSKNPFGAIQMDGGLL